MPRNNTPKLPGADWFAQQYAVYGDNPPLVWSPAVMDAYKSYAGLANPSLSPFIGKPNSGGAGGTRPQPAPGGVIHPAWNPTGGALSGAFAGIPMTAVGQDYKAGMGGGQDNQGGPALNNYGQAFGTPAPYNGRGGPRSRRHGFAQDFNSAPAWMQKIIMEQGYYQTKDRKDDWKPRGNARRPNYGKGHGWGGQGGGYWNQNNLPPNLGGIKPTKGNGGGNTGGQSSTGFYPNDLINWSI